MPHLPSEVIANAPGLSSEVSPRGRAWELAYLELSMLGAGNRPLNDLRTMLVDAIYLMARNEFPLAAPPRWLAELFEMVNRVVSLKTSANKWSLEPAR